MIYEPVTFTLDFLKSLKSYLTGIPKSILIINYIHEGESISNWTRDEVNDLLAHYEDCKDKSPLTYIGGYKSVGVDS